MRFQGQDIEMTHLPKSAYSIRLQTVNHIHFNRKAKNPKIKAGTKTSFPKIETKALFP